MAKETEFDFEINVAFDESKVKSQVERLRTIVFGATRDVGIEKQFESQISSALIKAAKVGGDAFKQTFKTLETKSSEAATNFAGDFHKAVSSVLVELNALDAKHQTILTNRRKELTAGNTSLQEAVKLTERMNTVLKGTQYQKFIDESLGIKKTNDQLAKMVTYYKQLEQAGASARTKIVALTESQNTVLKGTQYQKFIDESLGIKKTNDQLYQMNNYYKQLEASGNKRLKVQSEELRLAEKIREAAQRTIFAAEGKTVDAAVLQKRYGSAYDKSFGDVGSVKTSSAQVATELDKLKRISKDVATTDAELEKQTKAVTAALHQQAAAVSKANAELKPLAGSMAWTLQMAKRAAEYVAVYGGLFAVIGTVKSLATASIEAESATALLSAVLKISKTDAEALESQLQKTAVALGASIKDVNTAATIFARAGAEQKNVNSQVEVATKLAGLTGDTLEQSARAMVSFKENFKTLSIEQVGEKLGWLANETRLSTQGINTLGNYALATWTSLGAGIDTLNGLAAAMAKAGMGDSTIGTNIRRIGTLMNETKKPH